MIFEKHQLKDSVLVIVVLYRLPKVVKCCLDNLVKIIEKKDNTWLVLINNNAEPVVQDIFRSIKGDNIIKFDLPFNFGKALAVNFFFRDYISQDNLPKTIVSLDPDIIFSEKSYDLLIEAVFNCPKVGMLGMRYSSNRCNPERNLFFKPKKYIAKNNRVYFIQKPFMCTVAGGVFAIDAKKIFFDCDNQLFPKEKIRVYGMDDSSLYSKLRWTYLNGYLEGTEATHLFSAGRFAEGFEFLD